MVTVTGQKPKIGRDERRSIERERLEAAVRSLATTEGWLAFRKSRQRFYRYSFNNQLLLAWQAAEREMDLSYIASFKKWSDEFNRHVRKGEKALYVYAPRTGKRKIEDSETSAERVEEFIYFVQVPVFDFSQTDGDPLPEAPGGEIVGDSHETLIEKMVAFAGTLGYTVTFGAVNGGARGWCNPSLKRIMVAEAQNANARLRTLIHEVAHALGVGYEDYGRADAEMVVEAATFLAAGSVGLDTSPETLRYLASWGEQTDFVAFRKFGKVIDEVARKIEGVLAE